MSTSTPTGATTLPLASCSATTRSMRGNIGSERKLSTDTFFIIGCLFGSSYYPDSVEAYALWASNERDDSRSSSGDGQGREKRHRPVSDIGRPKLRCMGGFPTLFRSHRGDDICTVMTPLKRPTR